MEELEYNKASREHLDTWKGLKKISLWVAAAVVTVLLIMAATLTG